MFIKYDDCGDNIILNVPNTKSWKICYKLFNDNGEDDYALYLIVEAETILLRDTNYWCQGRPELSYAAVGSMYEEIVDIIASKIENEPNLQLIDIPTIERKLLSETYEQKWIEKGYIKMDATGHW